jgi:hypothetical protein
MHPLIYPFSTFFSSSNVKQLQIHGWLMSQSLFFLANWVFNVEDIKKMGGKINEHRS